MVPISVADSSEGLEMRKEEEGIHNDKKNNNNNKNKQKTGKAHCSF